MSTTLRLLSLTSLLVTGVATASLAANTESPAGNQSMTGTQTPATGNSGTAGAYGMNSRTGQHPSVVGPTGSTQPDATNPNRSAPNGEGGSSSAGGGNSGASGSR